MTDYRWRDTDSFHWQEENRAIGADRANCGSGNYHKDDVAWLNSQKLVMRPATRIPSCRTRPSNAWRERMVHAKSSEGFSKNLLWRRLLRSCRNLCFLPFRFSFLSTALSTITVGKCLARSFLTEVNSEAKLDSSIRKIIVVIVKFLAADGVTNVSPSCSPNGMVILSKSCDRYSIPIRCRLFQQSSNRFSFDMSRYRNAGRITKRWIDTHKVHRAFAPSSWLRHSWDHPNQRRSSRLFPKS